MSEGYLLLMLVSKIEKEKSEILRGMAADKDLSDKEKDPKLR